jgi:hypothetical protein
LFTGCSPELEKYSPPPIDSSSNSLYEKIKAKDIEEQKQALIALENADSLEDFLDVERSSWTLGTEHLNINIISEKRRKWYVSNNTNLSTEIKGIILAGKWKIGMKRNDLLASLGVPYSINRTVTSNIVHEQWVYDYDIRIPRRTTYLYFVNDVLTSWQD